MIGADEGAQIQLRAAGAQTVRLADSAYDRTAQPCWHWSGGPAAHRCRVLATEWVPAQAPRAGACASGPQKYAPASWRGAHISALTTPWLAGAPGHARLSSHDAPDWLRCVRGCDSAQQAATRPGLPQPTGTSAGIYGRAQASLAALACPGLPLCGRAINRRQRGARRAVEGFTLAARPAEGVTGLARRSSKEQHTAFFRPTASLAETPIGAR